ncbi:M20/M25/M40 family metallo-hydrolase [Streptomyces sp. DT20]|uniref:M20/M25/M40 family metallo-hydrolase n=1 Tax=Streptomyces sp. DT20 TaxID=3416519 RepID=UPI003CF6C81B
MDLGSRVDTLMDGLTADLQRLTAIPSVALPGFPAEPVRQAHDLLVDLPHGAGVERLDLPDTAPVIVAEVPPPTPDAPTVLLYGHYDVQPPGDESLWLSPPFEPTPVAGGLRARGIADDKSNLIVHLGVLRAYEGRPPTGLRIVLEGQEEYGSAFDDYPPTDPDRFACDAMVIAKLNLRFHPQQDPEEALGLLVPRQSRFAPSRRPARTLGAPAESPSTSSTRASGRHAESTHRTPRLYGQTSTDAALVTHLEALRPFGIPLTVTPGDTGPGFEPATGGPAYRAALTALREGWGKEPAYVASGGSIPLVNGLAKAVPGAEILLFGAQYSMCNPHAPNERVLFSELRSAVIAEAAFLREYAAAHRDGSAA